MMSSTYNRDIKMDNNYLTRTTVGTCTLHRASFFQLDYFGWRVRETKHGICPIVQLMVDWLLVFFQVNI
jgi:hypothetical protein